MTTTFKWTAPESIQTALSTGLNSLADGSTALSAAIANDTDLYQRINLEIFLDTYDNHLSLSAGLYFWFLSSVDGSNYEFGSAGVPGNIPSRSPDAVVAEFIQNSNTPVYQAITNLIIPPLSFKILLLSGLGGTMAATNNTVKYRRHNEQGV